MGSTVIIAPFPGDKISELGQQAPLVKIADPAKTGGTGKILPDLM